MWLPKPETYHGNKDILQCYEALIGGYITAHGQPCHWLFADSWGFYYTSMQQYGAYEPACVYPMWHNLNRIYGIRQRLFHGATLRMLADWLSTNQSPVFLVADQYELPWVTEYRMMHHDHYLAATAVSEDGTKLFIQDLWPNEMREWRDLAELESAFHARGSRALQLTEPRLKIDADLIRRLLTDAIARMRGEEREDYCSGLAGLRQFRQDVVQTSADALLPMEQRFDMLRRVVDVRYLFLEFLCFVQQQPVWSSQLPSGIISAVEKCIAAWQSLRNYMVLSSLKGNYRPARCSALLDKILECEQACLHATETWLARYHPIIGNGRGGDEHYETAGSSDFT